MAVKSKNNVSKESDFTGRWTAFRAASVSGEIKIEQPSTWVIHPTNMCVLDGKEIKCKVKNGQIFIPTTSHQNSFWVGEFKSKDTLKVSIDNGMVAYLCKRS